LPTITAAVAELDKKLQDLRPLQLSDLIYQAVKESALGITLGILGSDLVVKSGALPSAWSSGDVIISCNGVPIQSKADVLRALQFSGTCAMLVVAPAATLDQSAPMPAGWTCSQTSGDRAQYCNLHTRQISMLHPQLLMKETLPVFITLAPHKYGQLPQHISYPHS
jgi:hypothetical protein